MKDWRGEERHETPPPHPAPSRWQQWRPSPPLRCGSFSSTICYHLFAQIPFKQRKCVCEGALQVRPPSAHTHTHSQQEQPPGTQLLLFFHIICLLIAAHFSSVLLGSTDVSLVLFSSPRVSSLLLSSSSVLLIKTFLQQLLELLLPLLGPDSVPLNIHFTFNPNFLLTFVNILYFPFYPFPWNDWVVFSSCRWQSLTCGSD